MQRSSPLVSTGLMQVAGVHHAARRRAGADHRVDLIDEQDRVGHFLELVDDRFEPLLEVAAVLGAGDQRAHVERVDRARRRSTSGTLASVDHGRQPLGQSPSCRHPLRRRSSGLFLRRRHRICTVRSTSSFAADQRIDLASCASWLRFAVEYLSRALLAVAVVVAAGFFLGALFVGIARQLGRPWETKLTTSQPGDLGCDSANTRPVTVFR